MHEYYQKSSGKLKKTMRGFLSLVRRSFPRLAAVLSVSPLS